MRLCGLLLLCGFVVAGACAQEPQPPIHTLRVFTNTIQIPTVVLDESGKPVEEKSHPKFVITLDGGKPFPPTHVRVQGQDPISLAVLLDASGSQRELLSQLLFSLPMLAARGLEPHDHVSVYALDCELVTAMEDAPASKETLKAALDAALKDPKLHGGKKHGACADKLPLRDSLVTIARALKQLPGRRVILAVTGGSDTASTRDWISAAGAMQHDGAAVFGLALAVRAQAAPPGRGTVVTLGSTGPFEPAFNAFCQTSGGVVFTADDMTLTEKLRQMIEMLRARFVVEFPRGDELAAGDHSMTIKVVGKNYLIRSAGASMPVADPRLRNDPTVLRLPAPSAVPETP